MECYINISLTHKTRKNLKQPNLTHKVTRERINKSQSLQEKKLTARAEKMKYRQKLTKNRKD